MLFTFLWYAVGLTSLGPLLVACHDPGLGALSLCLRQQGNGTQICILDQSTPPGNLTFCGNSSLFSIWRPKARFIAPEGWMNDPQSEFTDRVQLL